MNQLETIQKRVRLGVLDVLDSGVSMTEEELAAKVDAAADIGDIQLAVNQLLDSHLIEIVAGSRPHAVRLAGVVGTYPPETAHPQRSRHRGVLDQCLQAMRIIRQPMTTQQIAEATDLDANNVRVSLNGARKRGAVISESDGKVNTWSLASEVADSVAVENERIEDRPAEAPDTANRSVPNGLLARCVEVIRAAGTPLSSAEIADALGEDGQRQVVKNLYKASAEHRQVCVDHRVGRTPVYGLIEWRDNAQGEHTKDDAPHPDDVAAAERFEPVAEPSDLAADRPANDAHRFALWSDGALEIHNGGDLIDLPPDATRELINYLIQSAPQVRALFDGKTA